MVLAHNEEKHITACLDSLFEGEPGANLRVFVMANGCTDGTERIVTEYGKRRPEVRLVSIRLGDKCNAWNVFVHETVPEQCAGAPVYFFMDGDARVCPRALTHLATGLDSHPDANAASAPPASGRTMERDRREILERHGLVANLYALRGSFVERLRESSVRIPLKLEGDDGLIGSLVKWDLEPRNPMDDRRIVPCANSGFVFQSMSPWNPGDWRAYWKRMVRYGRRRYEFDLLRRVLKSQGITAMPDDITRLYRYSDDLELRREGVYTLTNWIALRQMRRIGAQH